MIEMKEEARRKRRKKKTATSLVTSCFYGKPALNVTVFVEVFSMSVANFKIWLNE